MNGLSLFVPWLELLAETSPIVVILAKITILLALTWIGHALLKHANPRWRVLLWRGAAVGLVLIPGLHLALPPVTFSVAIPAIENTNELASASAFDLDAAVNRQFPPTDSASQNVGAFAHEPFAPLNESQPSVNWEAALLIVWSIVSFFLLLRICVGLRQIRSLVRDSKIAPLEVSSEFARAEHELVAFAKVRVSSRIRAPILCGILRPTLLIPERMTEPSSADQLPGVFAHELAHVRSRDLVWNLALHTSSAVLWFHPLAWLSRSVHASSCESVSDAVAVGYLGDVQTYCHTLARVALDAYRLPPLSLAMARKSDVHRRVQALERHVFTKRLRWQLATLLIAFGLIVTGTLGGFKAIRAEIVTPLQENDVAAQDDESKQDDQVSKPTGQARLVTPDTDTSVSKALAFLATRQRADGSFGGEKPNQNDPAMTALCGMALLAAGNKPNDGPYGSELQKLVDYLVGQVQDNGFIGIGPNSGSMYVHAYALRFLAESQLVHNSPRTEEAIEKAVALIVRSQNATDGWRYSPMSQDSDSSVTSCQLIALQLARRAGAEVPQETLDRATNYLQSCQSPDGGYGYTAQTKQSALPRSAAVMSALCLSGFDPLQAESGMDYLNLNATPPVSGTPYYFFSQFHLSTALQHASPKDFQAWYVAIRDQLLESQEDDGSWPLQSYVPEYPTAQACVVLLSPRRSVERPPNR